MINNKIKIRNCDMPNSVYFCLPQCFVDLILNKYVVIKSKNKEIIIKEATIDDSRVLKIMPNNRVNYTVFKDREEIIGEFNYEIEGESLILFRD